MQPRHRQRMTAAAAAVLVVAGLACAGADAAAPLTIARLHYGGGGDWYCDPSSLPNWLAEFSARTGLATTEQEAVVTLDGEELFDHPFLYASGHGRIDPGIAGLDRLRRYLDGGGFLYVDDNYGLDESFRRMCAELYPDAPLRRLGSEHPIYHCFYDLPGLPKIHAHDGDPAAGFGIERDGRLVLFYSWSSDIGDGLEDAQVHDDSPEAREAAVRMAVNILVYALTHP